VAAVRTGRDFVGNDLCEEAVRISRMRLRDEGAASEPLPKPVPKSQLALGV
jgi:site-specific DNA-methyltransferase (adenine-specific)